MITPSTTDMPSTSDTTVNIVNEDGQIFAYYDFDNSAIEAAFTQMKRDLASVGLVLDNVTILAGVR